MSPFVLSAEQSKDEQASLGWHGLLHCLQHFHRLWPTGSEYQWFDVAESSSCVLVTQCEAKKTRHVDGDYHWENVGFALGYHHHWAQNGDDEQFYLP